MSLRRVFRYLFGVIIAAVLLVVGLPFAGIPKSHFLPPTAVYAKAEGHTVGIITGKHHEETSDPFHVGAQLYFVDFQFSAPTPPLRGQTQYGPKQRYKGEVRVDQEFYDRVASIKQYGGSDLAPPVVPNQKVRVKYEKTYPDINGLDYPEAGRSCSAGSALLSGWLIWIGVAFALGYVVMLILERFGSKEDI